MKLLLTSIGLSDDSLRGAFLGMMGDWGLSEIKVALVSTAAVSKEEKAKVELNREYLLDLGVGESNILNIDIEDGYSVQKVKECQVMYVCGGNTFYLLDKMRKVGFAIVIRHFLDRGGVYVGVSAGSIVITPSIAIAGVEPADPNDVGITDFSGLGIVDFEVSPHVPEDVSYENFEMYCATTKNKVYAFDHNCALIVNDGAPGFVGNGHCRVGNP